MGITIKKSKLTLKAPGAEQPASDAAPVEGQPAPAEAAPQVASAERKPGKSIFDIIVVIIACFTLIIFVVLIGIQSSEWSFYKTPPSAWPPEFTPMQGVAAAPSTPEPEVAAPVAPEAAAPATAEPAKVDAAAPAAPAAAQPVVAPDAPKPAAPAAPADLPPGV